MSKTQTEWFSEKWSKNKKITAFFNQESDIPKLLTENRLVIKEIQKASKVNPLFTVDFCINLFMNFYANLKKMYPTYSWKKLVKAQTRRIMDFYVVARILKSNMKQVICYAGYNHTKHITLILDALQFKLIHSVDGKCSK